MRQDAHNQSRPPSAPRELNRLEVLHGLRVATWEAAFATVWATLTTGVFLTGYALWLGASNDVMGLITAIPTLAGLTQFVSSYFGERLPVRRPFTAWFSVAARTLWLLILLLPLVLSQSVALSAFLVLYALSYVLLNVPLPAYMSWMSDLVPADYRGRYFGRRNMLAGIVGMVVGLPAAWFLDYATRHYSKAVGFGVLFSIAVLGGLFSFGCLLRQAEPPRRVYPTQGEAPTGLASVWANYRAPFADKAFRRLLIFNVIFGLGQFFAAPFYTVWALQHLKLNFGWLQIFATLTSISSLASMPLWGYLADRFGNKPLLAIGAFGTATLPITWVFTAPDKPTLTFALVILVHLMGGLSWAGVGLTQFNMLIALSPPERTATYTATMSAVTGLTGGLAPILGSLTMRLLEGQSWKAGGFLLLNFQITFILSAVLRLAGLGLLRFVPDPNASSARNVLQQLSRSNPRAWLHIRDLQRGGDEETKLRATEALGEARTQLATAELQKALTDPSPAVRTEAAHALGEIGDPVAVSALISALHDPAAGVVAEAAHALERIGDRRATLALISLLEEDEAHLARRDRISIVRALGRLGGDEAAESLLALLQATEDEEEAETLVMALGEIRDARAIPVFLARLETTRSRPLRLALIRALGDLEAKEAVPLLRTILQRTGSDPALLPTLAETLARLDDEEAIPLLLDRLPGLESAVARKQVAHAIANLLGEGESVYGLLAQEDFTRDAAVARTLQEMQRRLRGTVAADALERGLQAYISGDYAEGLAALDEATQTLPESESAAAQRCRRTLDYLTHRASGAIPVETMLLAYAAFRQTLAEVGGSGS